MKSLKRILVATDLSKKSNDTLKRAIELAQINKATLFLIHVVHKTVFDKVIGQIVPAAKKIMVSPKEWANHMLQEKVASLSKHKIKMKTVVLTGEVPTQILRFSKDNQIDLMVVGAHGEHPVHDWFIGSTAETIIKKSSCPVLVVKQKPKKQYQKIIVPVDFSIVSQQAAQFAKQVLPKSQIHFLHVEENWYQNVSEFEDVSNLSLQIPKKTLTLLQSQMKNFLKKSGFKTNLFTIKSGYPASVIVNEAAKQRQDLIVMGTEGFSKKHYLLIGRVANRVLYDTRLDIMLVPPQKKKS
jgi:nucleotide-binding universal stress UspA family protein